MIHAFGDPMETKSLLKATCDSLGESSKFLTIRHQLHIHAHDNRLLYKVR
jgi:hypothetical protein